MRSQRHEKAGAHGPQHSGEDHTDPGAAGRGIHYYKTQDVHHYKSVIDTPGEYAQSRRLGKALALYTYEADIVGILAAANEPYSIFPAQCDLPGQPGVHRHRDQDRFAGRQHPPGGQVAQECRMQKNFPCQFPGRDRRGRNPGISEGTGRRVEPGDNGKSEGQEKYKMMNSPTCGVHIHNPNYKHKKCKECKKGGACSMMNELEIKKQICDIGKRIYNRNMVAANDGNISVKLNDHEFLCTPTGVSKGFMTPEFICKVDENGNVIQANKGFKPSSEIKMHMRVYQKRPDVGAVVHAHPTFATSFASRAFR